MLYKTYNNHVSATGLKSKLMPPQPRQQCGYCHQFSQLKCQTQYHQYSFLPRAIRKWHNLTALVIQEGTIYIFCVKDLQTDMQLLEFLREYSGRVVLVLDCSSRSRVGLFALFLFWGLTLPFAGLRPASL